MTDLIPRDAAIAAVYHADSFELSLCGTSRIEERIELIPTIDPAAIHEAALAAALAANRELVRINEMTEARVDRLVEALEEIASYDTGATAGLAYTARAALAAAKAV